MTASDQRKAKRQTLRYSARIDAVGGDGQIFCIIKDVSQTGGRVATDSPDQLPDEFILRLTTTDLPRRLCKVVWRSEHEAGVSFVQPPARGKITEMGVAVQPAG